MATDVERRGLWGVTIGFVAVGVLVPQAVATILAWNDWWEMWVGWLCAWGLFGYAVGWVLYRWPGLSSRMGLAISQHLVAVRVPDSSSTSVILGNLSPWFVHVQTPLLSFRIHFRRLCIAMSALLIVSHDWHLFFIKLVVFPFELPWHQPFAFEGLAYVCILLLGAAFSSAGLLVLLECSAEAADYALARIRTASSTAFTLAWFAIGALVLTWLSIQTLFYLGEGLQLLYSLHWGDYVALNEPITTPDHADLLFASLRVYVLVRVASSWCAAWLASASLDLVWIGGYVGNGRARRRTLAQAAQWLFILLNLCLMATWLRLIVSLL